MIFMNEGMRWRDRGPRGCLSGRFGANIQLLESLPSVDRGREEPTDNENPDDHVSDHPEIIVQAADGIPEPAAQMKFVCKQPEADAVALGPGKVALLDRRLTRRPS